MPFGKKRADSRTDSVDSSLGADSDEPHDGAPVPPPQSPPPQPPAGTEHFPTSRKTSKVSDDTGSGSASHRKGSGSPRKSALRKPSNAETSSGSPDVASDVGSGIGPRLTSRRSDMSKKSDQSLNRIPEGDSKIAAKHSDGASNNSGNADNYQLALAEAPALKSRLSLGDDDGSDNEGISEAGVLARHESAGTDNSDEADAMRDNQNLRMAAIARARAEMLAVETSMDEDGNNWVAKRRGTEPMSPGSPKNEWGLRRGSLGSDSTGMESVHAFGSKEWVTDKLTAFGFFEMNRPGILPLIFLTALWVVLAAMCIFGTFYVYAYIEVRGLELLASEGAAVHAEMHTNELLQAAPAAVNAIDLALRSGTLKSLSDYASISRLLRPHFKAGRGLFRLYLSDASGTVVLKRTTALQNHSDWGGVDALFQIRSDRENCGTVGRHTCSVAPIRAAETSWYGRSFGLYPQAWWALPFPAFWEGPVFVREKPDDATCATMCWAPAFTYTARITDGSTISNNASTIKPLSTTIVRAEVDARILQEVAMKSSELSRGEAFLADVDGALVASPQLGDSLFMDEETGVVRMRLASELDRPWASNVDAEFVQNVDPEGRVWAAERVSSWKIGNSNSTRGLEGRLRILIAVPQNAFIDPVLNFVLQPALGVGVAPFAVIGLWSLVAGFTRYCKTTRVQTSDFDPLLGPKTP